MRESGSMTCAYCGKRFRVAGGWGYAYGGLYTCSYKCMRKMKEEDSVTEEQKKIVDELEGTGLTAKEIAEKAGVNPQNVYDYKARKKAKAGERNEEPREQAREEEPAEPAAKPQAKQESLRETVTERYRYGWMCPMCRMVWSPWVSACCCQRREETGV